jgi:AcrR family transcriptional regulator
MTDASPLVGRRSQEQRIVAAVRALFDERGMQDASVDEISRAVGIHKATIYRHVASKDELFLLVLCSYQDELYGLYRTVDESQSPADQLARLSDHFFAFCERYPAYVSCALEVERYRYAELADRVSPAVMLRVNQAIALTNSRFGRAMAEASSAAGRVLDDPEQVNTLLHGMAMGAFQVIRAGVAPRAGSGGYPEILTIDQAEARAMIRTMLAAAVTALTYPQP